MFRRSGEETHAQKQWDWVSTVAKILVRTIDAGKREIALTQFHGNVANDYPTATSDGGMTQTTLDTGAEIGWQRLGMPSKEMHGVATVRSNDDLL